MPKLIARWNPARDVWETETTGLFCEHSDVFSATWPASGMTRGGVAYELPTSAHRTDGSASSSLLPTPQTVDANVTPKQLGPDGRTLTDHGANLRDVVPTLLPTPRTSDTNGAGMHGQGGMDLRTAVDLLPTPMARDWKGHGPADAERHDPNLSAISMLLPTPFKQELLPTPRAADWKGAVSRTAARDRRVDDGLCNLPEFVQTVFSGASTPRQSPAGNEC